MNRTITRWRRQMAIVAVTAALVAVGATAVPAKAEGVTPGQLTAAVVAFSAAGATASANGLTAAQLQAQGWTCVLVPVENLLHCRNPGSEPLVAGPTELDFLVFDASGDAFLGTEHLIRFDLYHEQPCNGTPTGLYEFIPRGPGYYACHHFTLP